MQKGSCFQVQLWARVSTAKAMRTVTSPVLAPGSGKAQHIVELMVVINLPSKCLLCNVARAKRKCRALAGFINSEDLAQSYWPSAALLSRAGGREQGPPPPASPLPPGAAPERRHWELGRQHDFPFPAKGGGTAGRNTKGRKRRGAVPRFPPSWHTATAEKQGPEES